MIYASIALFALSAVLGLTILIKWLTKKEASNAVIYSHGLVAVIAVLLLIGFAVEHPDHFPKICIILFAVAAVAGLYMFFTDLQKKPHSIAIAIMHALVAVSAFITLLFFAFT